MFMMVEKGKVFRVSTLCRIKESLFYFWNINNISYIDSQHSSPHSINSQLFCRHSRNIKIKFILLSNNWYKNISPKSGPSWSFAIALIINSNSFLCQRRVLSFVIFCTIKIGPHIAGMGQIFFWSFPKYFQFQLWKMARKFLFNFCQI